MNTIITRKEALLAGLKYYYNGKPCKNGHLSTRYVGGGCKECFSSKNYKIGHEAKRKYSIKNKEKELARLRESKTKIKNLYPWRLLIEGAKGRAKRAGLPFDLTSEWGREVWADYCAVSGLPFVFVRGLNRPHPFSPSLDRINPELGYVQGNCRFVLQAVNMLKGEMSDEMVLILARAIVKNLDKKAGVEL